MWLDDRRNPIGPDLRNRLGSLRSDGDKAILNGDGKHFAECALVASECSYDFGGDRHFAALQ
ncbi:MAG: hypothetical protein ACPGLY_16665 [Rubripirellula sp.]